MKKPREKGWKNSPESYGRTEPQEKRRPMKHLSLAFGIEAVVLIEMGMLSYRVNHYDPKVNEDMAKLSLDLLEEKRDTRCIRMVAYKERVTRYYNRRVKKREFKKRDLVLRKARHTLEGKFAPN